MDIDFISYLPSILILVISTFIFFIFKNYLPKYFESKAANLAQKEDIGEITEIVESIKKQFMSENEILKSQLALTGQNEFSFNDAERTALISVNKMYSSWLYSMVNFDLTHYNLGNFKNLMEDVKQHDFKKAAFDIAIAEMEVFTNDVSFTELTTYLNLETLKLSQLLIEFAIRVGGTLEMYKYRMDNSISEEDRRAAIQKHSDEVMPILQEFGDKRLEIYSEILKKRIPWLKEINTKLVKIFNNEQKAKR